jgi:uncharacterized ferritin-like protein (DUF455 family)
MISSIGHQAIKVLKTANADEKARISHVVSKNWMDGGLSADCREVPPERPGRPDKPDLLLPRDMPKRRNAKARAARIAMLHAIAHIELNAIDLAWDMVARFGNNMPKEFIDDWVQVADDEARHFELLNNRLQELGSYYGALPAHDGLWQSAMSTAHNLLARLAILPLVLEARGLDVTPPLIAKFELANDIESASALTIIYQDEIDHVRFGQKWFLYLCELEEVSADMTYQKLVREYFSGSLKPPFNIEARSAAGMYEDFYMPLVNIKTN